MCHCRESPKLSELTRDFDYAKIIVISKGRVVHCYYNWGAHVVGDSVLSLGVLFRPDSGSCKLALFVPLQEVIRIGETSECWSIVLLSLPSYADTRPLQNYEGVPTLGVNPWMKISKKVIAEKALLCQSVALGAQFSNSSQRYTWIGWRHPH